MSICITDKEITIIVLGEPVAQARAKNRFYKTADGQMRVTKYDPEKSRTYKQLIQLEAQQYRDKPLDGPLYMRLDIFRSIPKSFSRKKYEQAIDGYIRPTTRPDCSNYLKGVEDALNGVIYKDDSCIVDSEMHKWYSDRPRIEITIIDRGEKYDKNGSH